MGLKFYSMKNIGKVLIALSLFVFACSSDSDQSDNDNGQTIEVSSIYIETVNKLFLDNDPSFQIRVISSGQKDLTSESEIYVNGQLIDGYSFTPEDEGDYSVFAKYGDVESPVHNVEVTVINNIEIFASSQGVGKGQEILFNVEDDLGNTLSDDITFFINDTPIDSGIFSTTEMGNYSVYAEYESKYKGVIKSETLNFDVAYTQKVLVEDYTGAWCGYCPRVSYKLAKAESDNPNVVSIGIHYNDGMHYSKVNSLVNYYGVTGFPTAIIDRTSIWNESNLPWDGPFNSLDNKTKKSSNIGIGIGSTISSGSVSVNVDVDFLSDEESAYKLVVYLLEDGVVEPQTNYFNADKSSPWYGYGSVISNFVHDNVLRGAFTDDFGMDITNQLDGVFKFQKTINIPSNVKDNDKLEIVAMVLSNTSKVLNVEHAEVGEFVDMD